ncbi:MULTISPECIES: hypothetical protein [Thermococcus]|uniref:Uncharacterized protein n=1 Tax=Thermococcus nautili TaxID=195522 RepID=W8P3M4_9EURY|nr:MULTISPECIES: hypothetical protein [Thermococcus]AHL23381.1 hypothetical protein BD01_1778 [Thermococcus nautili]NJE49594.1 hypothetical protein [Thermococcus sp. 9N3]CAI1492627.1 conserved protein of unknown function [Thermococcus nautili]
MSLRKLIESFRGRMLLAGLLVFLSIVPGEYYVRWIAAFTLAVILGIILIEKDVKIPYSPRKEESYTRPLKPDFERALTIVSRAKAGKRNLAEEELLEILYTLYDGEFNYQELRSNPPPALKAFYSSPNPYEGLKRAIKILEAELNED